MNELVSVSISPWYTIPAAVGLLSLTFVFAPGVLLHIGVLLYPREHDRRREFTAELDVVAYIKRPFWVAGVLVRCLFEGTSARRAERHRKAKLPGPRKSRRPHLEWKSALIAMGAALLAYFLTNLIWISIGTGIFVALLLVRRYVIKKGT